MRFVCDSAPVSSLDLSVSAMLPFPCIIFTNCRIGLFRLCFCFSPVSNYDLFLFMLLFLALICLDIKFTMFHSLTVQYFLFSLWQLKSMTVGTVAVEIEVQ